MAKLVMEDILQRVSAAQEMRADAMPTAVYALMVMAEAKKRLEDLGFRDAVYCPKDGSTFDAVEAGCTAVLTCSYLGDWPKGSWFAHEAGDLWPCRPVLFRPSTAVHDGPDSNG